MAFKSWENITAKSGIIDVFPKLLRERTKQMESCGVVFAQFLIRMKIRQKCKFAFRMYKFNC